MKYLNRLLIVLSMLLPVALWAQESSKSYLNLGYNATAKALYVAVMEKNCKVGSTVSFPTMSAISCVASVDLSTADIESSLRNLLFKYWKRIPKVQNYEADRILLDSDLNFKQLNIGMGGVSCNVVHQPFNFSGTYFDGKGHTISGLCTLWEQGTNLATGNPTDTVPEFGLFSNISNATVKNLVLDSIQFIVRDSKYDIESKSWIPPSDEEKHYNPMGALAGMIFSGTVENILLGDIVINGPLSGGLAGYVEQTTFNRVEMKDPTNSNMRAISVTNNIVLEKNETDGMMGSYKTVLGGLVGASYSSTFKNINIYPFVVNSAAVKTSALGGIAGLFVYAENATASEVVIDKAVVAGPTRTNSVKIEGGTAMGGLFGDAKRSAIVTSDLLITNALVENMDIMNSVVYASEHSNVAGNDSIYMGGLVGKGEICNAGVLKIKNSRALKFGISENVSDRGTYQFYLGGLAGYAGCNYTDNAGNREDQYLTLTNSHASGTIMLRGGYSSSNGGIYHISGAMGGLVGSALFASKNAVMDDTSSVSITYNAANTPVSSTSTAEDALYVPDSVAVGGVFGEASLFNTSGITLDVKRVVVDGYSNGQMIAGNISFNDDGISSYVGGVIGKYPHIPNAGNSGISFNNVRVSSPNNAFISYMGKGGSGAMTQASIGGICGQCQSVENIYRTSVVGNIVKGSGSALNKKQFYVGGLVGRSTFTSRATRVGNTYSIGKFDDFAFGSKTDAGEKTGYLFGMVDGGGTSQVNEFTSNYHVGDDDVAAIGNFGSYKIVRNLSELPAHMMKAVFNVRDSSATKLLSGNGGSNNGCMTADAMKEKQFMDDLNSPWEFKVDQIWNRIEGDYPVFDDEPSDQVLVTFVGFNGKVIDKQWVAVGEAANPPTVSDEQGYCFDSWNSDFSSVAEAMTVTAVFKQGNCNESSSSNAKSSSSSEGIATNSSSSRNDNASSSSHSTAKSSSSNVILSSGEESSDSSTLRSSNSNAKSSSSSEGIATNSSSSRNDNVSSSSYNNAKSSSSNVILSSGEESSDSSTLRSSSSTAKSCSSSKGIATNSSSSRNDSASSSSNNNAGSSSSSEGIATNSSSSRNDNASSSSNNNAGSSSSSVILSFGEESSDSTTLRSSSSFDESSSSSKTFIREFVGPVVTQEGNALRMTFNDEQNNLPVDVNYHVLVETDAGIYLDTLIKGKDVELVKNGTWRLEPAPVGEYSVTFTLTNGVDSSSYKVPFKAKKEKQVNLVASSWQTYSLYAFCHEKGEGCRYNVVQRFANEQENKNFADCSRMKEELEQGYIPENDAFYEEMNERCRVANDLNNSTASIYWWDETRPIGAFWQYRQFKVSDVFDSTRGYWYGPVDDEPMTLDLQTPNMDDEIVWDLHNNYSGWNLVANPFGWYVKLPQNSNVTFRQWDPSVSDCVPVDTLGPYEAVWAYTEESRVLRIPLKAAIILEGKKEALSKTAESESWNLRVVLADDNGKRDSWNELAAGRKASSLSEPPSGMGDRVNLSIVDGKQRLAKSVKKNSDDLEWNLEASATSSRKGHLSFVGLESVWAKGLRVYATVNDETVEVVNDYALDVQLSSKAKNVSVRVTKNTIPVNVTKKLISGFHIGQMAKALNVGFDVASNLAGANVKVSIVGVDGRIVAAAKSVASEGTNAVSLKKPKQGVYFVRVKVGSQSATSRIVVR